MTKIFSHQKIEKNTTISKIFSLNQEEQNDFGLFLKSPFFNTNSKLVDLYTLIIKEQHKKYPKIDIENLAKKQQLNSRTINNYLSILNQFIDDFYAHQNLKNSNLEKALQGLKYIDNTDRKNEFASKLNDARKILTSTNLKEQQRTELLNYETSFLYNEIRLSRLLNNTIDKQDLLKLIDLEKEKFMLIYVYLLSEYYVITKEKIDEDIISNILNLEEKNKTYNASKLYLLAYKLETEPIAENYRLLFNYVWDNIDEINKIEVTKIKYRLENYCIAQINKGDSSFASELYKNLKLSIENNILVEPDGYISASYFKNAVKTFLHNNDIKGANAFIEKSFNHIETENKDIALTYAKALIYFTKKDYNKCARTILSSKASLTSDKIQQTILLIKVYFETEDIDNFEKQTKKLKKLGKSLPKYETSINNFIEKIRLILKNKHHKKELKNIKNQINKIQTIEKDWLLSI